MILQFLKLYVENLQMFSLEMNQNQQSIQLSRKNIKTLALEVQKKLKLLFSEMVKRDLVSVSTEQNSQIKIIYLLMKQIQKINAEKRSLTRKACELLDKYFESLDELLKSFEINNDSDIDLLNAIRFIRPVIRQPVEGKALLVDLIKKMENGESKNLNQSHQSDFVVVDDVNRNVEMFSQNFIKVLTLQDMSSGENFVTHINVSELTHRLDNLQHFIDKIFDICSSMRSSYKIEELNHNTPTNNDNSDSESETEENAELCYCRSQDIGKMVACDNSSCNIRWYHFECVGLYTNPEGRWFCPRCLIFEDVTV